MMKKSKHPSLSEVAKRAGVGTTTVSRVINGGHRVDPKTLARVLDVIETLGYMPSQAARTLKGDRSGTIGLIVPSIADPFFSSCAEVVQSIARANDSLLIVATTQNDPHAEVDDLNVLIRHRVDGLIIAPANSQSKQLTDILRRAAVPVVAIDRPLIHLPIPSVVADNFNGAYSATRHLIDHHYKRIVCLTGETTLYSIRERIHGYRKAVESAGLACILDTSIKDYESAKYAIESLFARADPPDAIFTLKNSTTIYAFEALEQLNIPVPDCVALLGYDDFELAATVRPSITVVQQPIEEIGRIAAELLFEQLLSVHRFSWPTGSARPQQVKLATRLIRRRSCGCPQAEAKRSVRSRRGRGAAAGCFARCKSVDGWTNADCSPRSIHRRQSVWNEVEIIELDLLARRKVTILCIPMGTADSPMSGSAYREALPFSRSW